MNHRRIEAAVFLLAAVLIAGLLFPESAYAARTRPVLNIENAPVPDGLTSKEVRNAIIQGAANRTWVAKRVEAGHIVATLHIRSHMAQVDIYYDENQYSIRYKNSDNLKYKNGYIHRNYNGWIEFMNGDIQNELQKVAP